MGAPDSQLSERDFHQQALSIAKEHDRVSGAKQASGLNEPNNNQRGYEGNSFKGNAQYKHPEFFINDINNRYKF